MLNIGPTPFDLRFSVFRIPIRVHPSFWVMTALFGWSPNHTEVMFIWMSCAFVSILIHELGHALTAESYGWPTDIVLYFGGGLAISQRYRNNTPLRSIAVSFMGPMAGFMLLGLVYMIEPIFIRNHIWESPYRGVVFEILEFMNLYWGLLNLLPVLPLDGGHIFQASCQFLGLRDPVGVSTKVGFVVGAAATYYFLAVTKQQFAGILMLMLCVENFSAMQSRR